MSVCVYFRTAKQFKAEKIYGEIADRGEKIMLGTQDFPSLKLGSYQEALRGIEINKEDYGYEVRVCSFANRADLHLFIVAVDVMKSLTGVKAMLEDEEEVSNPKKFFDDNWVEEQVESSREVVCALVQHNGVPIIMSGLFFPICFGPLSARSFGINLLNPQKDAFDMLQFFLSKLQWYFGSKKGTSTRLAIPNPAGEDERPLNISLIYAENGKVQPFDYVTYADVVGLVDKDGDVVMIHIEDFARIAQAMDFAMLDDYQYSVREPLSYDDFKKMQNMARLYQVDDLFFAPLFPGEGYDERQKTFVLMWNPAVSNVKMENFVKQIPELLTSRFDWNVYDYDKAKKGDKFIMVRCGEGRTGLVMSGVFSSNPYPDEDWDGKGQPFYYMDLKPNFIADPERVKSMITTEDLQMAFSYFNWTGGPSGRLLTDDQSEFLEKLLTDYLSQFYNNVDGITVNGFALPEDDCDRNNFAFENKRR